LKGFRGDVRSSSIARWKARVDFLFVIIKLFFAFSYGWDIISGNLSKAAFFEGGGLGNLSANFRRKGCRPRPTVVRKLKWLAFRAVSKYPQCTVCFSHKAPVWRTDRLTDRQNYDSWFRASIAARAVIKRALSRSHVHEDIGVLHRKCKRFDYEYATANIYLNLIHRICEWWTNVTNSTRILVTSVFRASLIVCVVCTIFRLHAVSRQVCKPLILRRLRFSSTSGAVAPPGGQKFSPAVFIDDVHDDYHQIRHQRNERLGLCRVVRIL